MIKHLLLVYLGAPRLAVTSCISLVSSSLVFKGSLQKSPLVFVTRMLIGYGILRLTEKTLDWTLARSMSKILDIKFSAISCIVSAILLSYTLKSFFLLP